MDFPLGNKKFKVFPEKSTMFSWHTLKKTGNRCRRNHGFGSWKKHTSGCWKKPRVAFYCWNPHMSHAQKMTYGVWSSIPEWESLSDHGYTVVDMVCHSAFDTGSHILCSNGWNVLLRWSQLGRCSYLLPGLVNIQKAMENGYRNSGFSH